MSAGDMSRPYTWTFRRWRKLKRPTLEQTNAMFRWCCETHERDLDNEDLAEEAFMETRSAYLDFMAVALAEADMVSFTAALEAFWNFPFKGRDAGWLRW
jgi:hypothetical protein